MRRARRSVVRIDYKLFHKSGTKVPLDVVNSQELDSYQAVETMSKPNKIMFESYGADVDDLIEENPISDICTSQDELDTMIKKIEELRSIYRANRLEIGEDLSVDEIEDYESRLLSIKTYIFTAKVTKVTKRCLEVKF